MLLNFNLAILAVLAGVGLAAALEPAYDQRMRGLGRVFAAWQNSCYTDIDCHPTGPGTDMCCSGLAHLEQDNGPGKGFGIGSCIAQSDCSGGSCFVNGIQGSCDTR
ncbi:hypothetical protein DFH09DRAFT_1074144 [Mycena vulgaris]|nr:hypothetical protein DFH09DRAFT_1074144 [Mycena vulgaris]